MGGSLSPGLPLPTPGPLHLASPHAVPGSLPSRSLTLSGSAGPGASVSPVSPSFLSGHPLHFLNSGLPRPGLHFVTAVIPGRKRYKEVHSGPFLY